MGPFTFAVCVCKRAGVTYVIGLGVGVYIFCVCVCVRAFTEKCCNYSSTDPIYFKS